MVTVCQTEPGRGRKTRLITKIFRPARRNLQALEERRTETQNTRNPAQKRAKFSRMNPYAPRNVMVVVLEGFKHVFTKNKKEIQVGVFLTFREK